jgi:hypothetical protein
MIGGWCGGTLWDTFSAESAEGETWHSLELPGDDPESEAVEGCTEGQTVSFTIDGAPAVETAVWTAGGQARVDLTTILGAAVRKEVSTDGTTWHDADTEESYPPVEMGADVTWRIAVTNTSELTVTLVLTDALDGTMLNLSDACETSPPGSLPPAGEEGSTYRCTIPDEAERETHRNVITATVVSEAGALTVADVAGYIGRPTTARIYLPLILR